MKPIATQYYRDRTNSGAVRSFAFSQDGRWLAMNNGRDTPYLFDAETLTELAPYPGHAEHLKDVFFLEDGKHLRSIGADDRICMWDGDTMAMTNRIKAPDGFQIESARPWDGRYAVCVETRAVQDHKIGTEGTIPAKVIDCDTGRVVCELFLPRGAWRARLHWVNEKEALVQTRNGLCRFDFRKGEILSTIDSDSSSIGYAGEITEDGDRIFVIHQGSKGSPVCGVTIVRTDTGKATDLDFPDTVTSYQGGLIPGGEYFYLASPHVHIHDRDTLSVVTCNTLDRFRVRHVSFRADGERYAVLTEADNGESESRMSIQVFTTVDSRRAISFDTSSMAHRIKMSPNGERIAVLNRDYTIELFALEDTR